MSWAQKQPRLRNFLNQDKNKSKLNFSNSDCETRTITRHVQNRNPTKFYCKEKKSYNKKTYQKSILNRLKLMKNSTFIYTPWAPRLKKFLKKFPIYMCPMFTHVCIMSELKFN